MSSFTINETASASQGSVLDTVLDSTVSKQISQAGSKGQLRRVVVNTANVTLSDAEILQAMNTRIFLDTSGVTAPRRLCFGPDTTANAYRLQQLLGITDTFNVAFLNFSLQRAQGAHDLTVGTDEGTAVHIVTTTGGLPGTVIFGAGTEAGEALAIIYLSASEFTPTTANLSINITKRNP